LDLSANHPVEFPPRLKASPGMTDILEEGLFDGREQAKIA
jgi:cell cycle sensor histidine kinase DivJ